MVMMMMIMMMMMMMMIVVMVALMFQGRSRTSVTSQTAAEDSLAQTS